MRTPQYIIFRVCSHTFQKIKCPTHRLYDNVSRFNWIALPRYKHTALKKVYHSHTGADTGFGPGPRLGTVHIKCCYNIHDAVLSAVLFLHAQPPETTRPAGAARRARRDLRADPVPFVARPWIRPQWVSFTLEPRCM